MSSRGRGTSQASSVLPHMAHVYSLFFHGAVMCTTPAPSTTSRLRQACGQASRSLSSSTRRRHGRLRVLFASLRRARRAVLVILYSWPWRARSERSAVTAGLGGAVSCVDRFFTQWHSLLRGAAPVAMTCKLALVPCVLCCTRAELSAEPVCSSVHRYTTAFVPSAPGHSMSCT